MARLCLKSCALVLCEGNARAPASGFLLTFTEGAGSSALEVSTAHAGFLPLTFLSFCPSQFFSWYTSLLESPRAHHHTWRRTHGVCCLPERHRGGYIQLTPRTSQKHAITASITDHMQVLRHVRSIILFGIARSDTLCTASCSCDHVNETGLWPPTCFVVCMDLPGNYLKMLLPGSSGGVPRVRSSVYLKLRP